MTLSSKTISNLASALTLVMVIALGAQLAWWGWHFAKPSTIITAVNADNQIDLAQAQHLFGQAEVSTVRAPSSASNNAPPSDVRLKGVFAVDGKTPSAAVVNIGGRDLAVKLNEKINDNITLVDVKADHIVIARAGARERIELDRSSAKPAPSTTATATANASAPQGTFRLNVTSPSRNNYALSRSELNTVLQDPRQINFLGTIGNSPSGGVQVQSANAGTLANKLGLQAGDIITQINGQPVNGAGDLARLYGQFGTTNTIRAEVRRSGTPMVLTYNIGN